jgi:hypothetical protein
MCNFIQPKKCVAWSLFGLPLDFETPSQFNTPSKGIKFLGVPLGTSSFKSSFIQNTLREYVWHVDLFLKLGDVQVTFGILTHCYAQRPLYLLCCTPLYLTFIDSFISFDSSFLQVFGCLLGPRSFDSFEGPLAHKQASFPITLDGIGFILTTTITPTTYLGSWALVVSIIAPRFMVD